MEKLDYRHGDVGLVPASIPQEAKSSTRKVLAYGEQTGHSHAIAAADLDGAEIFECEDRVFLRVTKEGGVSLVHQEHAEITVAPGSYEIRIAREYDEEQDFRRVTD